MRIRRPCENSQTMSRKAAEVIKCPLCGNKDVTEPRGDERYCRDCWDRKIAVEDVVAREFTLKRYIRATSGEKYLVFHSTQKRPIGLGVRAVYDHVSAADGRHANPLPGSG